MKRLLLILILFVALPPFSNGQTVLLTLKGGLSSYGTFYLGNFGGGGGDHEWDTGPILSAGARLRSSELTAFDCLVEYSTHRRQVEIWNHPETVALRNSIFESTAMARLSWGILGPVYMSFLGGLSLSWQFKDQVTLVTATSVLTGTNSEGPRLGLVIGTGLEVRTSSRLELSIEGALRGRYYITPTAQLSAAYLL